MIWLLAMVSIWVYPLVAFYFIKGTRTKLRLRKRVLIVVIGVSLIAIIGLLTELSTTSLEMDTIIVTSLYLSISLAIWIGIESKRKFVRAAFIVLGVLIFGIGYLSGTIGALGIAFIANSFEPTVVKLYDNGIIYKERPLGNAISNFRGKEVEIYETISWLPVVEWRLISRKYYHFETYRNSLQVKYLDKSGFFVLSLPDSIKIGDEIWVDTLRVE